MSRGGGQRFGGGAPGRLLGGVRTVLPAASIGT
jgi:hypothetical protein